MRLTNGKVIVEVPDHKAEFLSVTMGYRIMDETPEVEEVVEAAAAPKPRRGRPPKKAS